MSVIYIAGPMSGHPDYNYPAFNVAAARLRASGHIVENPAENPEQNSWLDYMRLSIRQVSEVDGIALLPGWEASRGATLEVHIANALGLPVKSVEDWL